MTSALAISHFRMGQPERTEHVLVDYDKQLEEYRALAIETSWQQKRTRSMTELVQFYKAWNKPDKAASFERKLKEFGVAQALQIPRRPRALPRLPGPVDPKTTRSQTIDRSPGWHPVHAIRRPPHTPRNRSRRTIAHLACAVGTQSPCCGRSMQTLS